MRAAAMVDNSDVQEVHFGKITDVRMEQLLRWVIDSDWEQPDLDQLYTEVVQEFISAEVPTLLVSAAGANSALCNGVLFLSMMHLDFRVTHAANPNWPAGGFDYMPNATIGIEIVYDCGEKRTDMMPGLSTNQAALGAIIQYARELSWDQENQLDLFVQ